MRNPIFTVRFCIPCLVIAMLGFTSTCDAALVTSLVNGGFEDGPTSPGFNDTIPSWSEYAEYHAGVWDNSDPATSGCDTADGFPAFIGDNAGTLISRNADTEDEAWIFQSLGTVDADDVGQVFALSAGLGCRNQDRGTLVGDLTVAFRTGTTDGGALGAVIGTPYTMNISLNSGTGPAGLVTHVATFTPVAGDVGTEIFAVVDLLTSDHVAGEEQFIVDGVSFTNGVPGTPPSINDNFDDESGVAPPGGWSYDPRNGGGSPTITEDAGVVTFSGGAGVVSIVNDTVFNPQKGQPITGVLQVESLGADDAIGFYLTSNPDTRDSQVGIHILSNGEIGLNADPGGGFNSGTDSFTLTTLSGYAGGPLELTLELDSNGFTASTDFDGGWTSGPTTWESLGNDFDLSVLGIDVQAFIQAYNGSGVSTVIDSFSLTAGNYVPVPGDADGDGRVDEDDAAVLAANWLQSGGSIGWANGDFNDDKVVNDIDATIMAANWGYGVGAAVPEPSTLAGLLGLCLAGLLAVARRKRRPFAS